MKWLKRLDDNLEQGILIITYTAMLIIASAQVIFRYVINFSISWSQDLLTYMLIWSVFIGISLAVKRRRHIKVELLFVFLSEKFQFFLRVFSNVAFMVFCVVFSYFALVKINKLIFVNPQISESTGLSMWVIQIAVPIGFLLSFYRLIVDTRNLYLDRQKEKAKEEGER